VENCVSVERGRVACFCMNSKLRSGNAEPDN